MRKSILMSVTMVFMVVSISCGVVDTGDFSYTGDTGDVDNTFACPDNDKFCHEYDRLNWSDLSSFPMDLEDAFIYCGNLGGRLPTISELRKLIKNCPGTETDGECGVVSGVVYSCLSEDCWTAACNGCEYDKSDAGKYSVFNDLNFIRSSSPKDGDTGSSWVVTSYNGSVINRNDIDTIYVRCVQ